MTTASASDVFVVVPAFNEAEVIGEVLDGIRSADAGYRVAVVDDGSTDQTPEIARGHGVPVLRHVVNLGQGAALRTGIEFALEQGAEVIVTFDADGQMVPSDIGRLVQSLFEGSYDVVLGTRFAEASPDGLPRSRRILLRLATMFTRWTTGLPVTDAHNGLRAFRRDAAAALRLNQERMAHASEILHDIAAANLRWKEVPVNIRYTAYSRRKGQRAWGAVDIVVDLLWRMR